MLSGPLHDRGPYGRCTACGAEFPCETANAIFNSVVREPVRWEDLENHEARCPKCLHWWVSHGVPVEDDYGCSMIESSADERWAMAERDRELRRRGVPPEVAGPQAYRDLRYCGCAFAEGNTVTPRQVRIWHDGSSWPVAPWQRVDCGHHRRGPIQPDDSQQCLDCGVVLVSDG